MSKVLTEKSAEMSQPDVSADLQMLRQSVSVLFSVSTLLIFVLL